MFSTVTSVRLRLQLSSSVSSDTISGISSIGAAQEVKAPVAALDGAPDHRRHEDETNTLALPVGIAATLVEVDRVAPREPVPGGDGRAIDIQRGQPEPPACREFGSKPAVQPSHAAVLERAFLAFPPALVQGHEVA